MESSNLVSFKGMFLKPCKKVLRLFKFKLHKPVFIRAFRIRRKKRTATKAPHEGRLSKIMSVLHSLRRTREVDRVTELKSFSETGNQRAPYPSPITPAYIRMGAGANIKKEVLVQDDVEDACRSFENYLTEMIVEEGKMRDLVDVEELLYYWKNLKCPIFTDLVCRFYGELCKDLFSNSSENDIETPKGLLR